MLMKGLAAAAIALMAMLGTVAFGQMEHGHGDGHGTPNGDLTPKAAGQDTFAAIAEIVQILESDPHTDWSRVNIGALHQHLLDMDALMTQANVTEEDIANGLRMRIGRSGAGGEAAGRMVPAHGPFLEAATGWTSNVDVQGDEIVWTVSAASEAGTTKIRALGFFGLMATGAHHKRHHLAIARGETMH
jgi:hypothetical protein